MTTIRLIALVTVFGLTSAVSAVAQQIGPAAGATGPGERGYVAALAGVMSGPPTEPVFSVEYGEHMHPNAQAYATLSYFENIMGSGLRNQIAALGVALSDLTGDPWHMAGRDRAVTFAAGAKYLVGSAAVRPYLAGGAGVINVRRTIVEVRLGDITEATFRDFNVGAADLSLLNAGVTRPLMEAGVGLGIVAGRTYLDLGYRYRRAFRLTDRLEFSQFSAGIGYAF